jgi:hypothetical protein
MSVNVTLAGVVYPIPVAGDRNWAPPLTRYLVALASATLQPTGGSFPLTADINFGTNFGLLAKYFTSVTVNPSHTGVLRLADTDSVGWRNNANSADLLLSINGSDQLTFNGVPIGASAALTDNHIYVGNASNQPADVAMSGDATIVASGALTISAGAVTASKIASGTITDTQINTSAAIAVSKLAALTASQLVVTNGSGVLSTLSSPTLTEIGYVAGVTSAIQTQINNITAIGVPLGAVIDYFSATPPNANFKLANGQAISRTTYSSLNALLSAAGYPFGSGDGSTTFNLPDYRDNFCVGAGATYVVGTTGGSTVVSITDPGHDHIQDPHQHIGTSAEVGTSIVTGTLSGGGAWPFGETAVTSTTTAVTGTNQGSSTIAFANTSETTATNQAATTGITAMALPQYVAMYHMMRVL